MKMQIMTSIAFAAILAMTATASAQDWDDAGDDDLFGEETPVEEEETMTAETDAQVEAETPAADSPLGLGIGIANTLAGVRGGQVEFYVGDSILIEGLLGYQMFSPDVDGADTASLLALAVGAFYRIAGDERTTLFLGGRLDLGMASDTDPMTDGATQINIEVPARVQLYLSPALAVHFEAGLVLGFVPEEGAALPPGAVADSTVMTLGGQLFGAGGITVYLQ